jgi:hypothetical protein
MFLKLKRNLFLQNNTIHTQRNCAAPAATLQGNFLPDFLPFTANNTERGKNYNFVFGSLKRRRRRSSRRNVRSVIFSAITAITLEPVCSFKCRVLGTFIIKRDDEPFYNDI